jgi:hypothetical protein
MPCGSIKVEDKEGFIRIRVQCMRKDKRVTERGRERTVKAAEDVVFPYVARFDNFDSNERGTLVFIQVEIIIVLVFLVFCIRYSFTKVSSFENGAEPAFSEFLNDHETVIAKCQCIRG